MALRGVGLFAAGALLLGMGAAVGAGAATRHKGGGSMINKAAATQQATADFVTLFNSNDKNEKARENVLQAASKYESQFTKLFSSKVAKSNPTLAHVVTVSFPASAACSAATQVAQCAEVTYDIDTATTGSALLSNQTGYAVYVGHKWLVSDASFCALAKLAGESC
jgi:hypothetical protein